jgi:hypothetical protein
MTFRFNKCTPDAGGRHEKTDYHSGYIEAIDVQCPATCPKFPSGSFRLTRPVCSVAGEDVMQIVERGSPLMSL